MLARAALTLILCAICVTTKAENPRIERELKAAFADRQQFPQSDWWRYYYVTTSCGHPETKLPSGNVVNEQRNQEIALKFVVASASRQTVLERCTPVQVSPTLFRIDLADLKWDAQTWRNLVANNPYAQVSNCVLIRADWLVVVLGDDNELSQPFYLQLLFGKQPKNRDEALQILDVSQREDLQQGWIEGKSGVSVNGQRWIAQLGILSPGAYAWGTRDVIKLDREHDM